MKNKLLFLVLLLIISCSQNDNGNHTEQQVEFQEKSKEIQDSIINEHLVNGAWKHGLYSREWQEEIDKGLAKDSTIAYLWQQKAMPLFKQGKYELGMGYLDKAVFYDQDRWQEYRAFIKCIFVKNYTEAISDFEDCRKRMGNSYVMDHSYNFYIALCKIQLNEFSEAESLLEKEVERQLENHGEDFVHPNELFYLGIARYEQGKYEDAILVFDQAIKLYPQFSEALFYKGHCEANLGNREEGNKLVQEAKKYGKEGYSINEANTIYERYPYQIRRELWDFI